MWISFPGLATGVALSLLITLFIIHSSFTFLTRKRKARLLNNLISVIVSAIVIKLIPDKKFDSSPVLLLLLPPFLYFGLVFYIGRTKAIQKEKREKAIAENSNPKRSSC
jgi:hypothetical protein